ncbi:hypothetical protein L2E82_24539 [Cichorium intybus]|uniref:Uncharacterized protein n=1 Tax=Cichorium intybus TaxID=13427 RepID=A0ACB9E0Z9_CICIN|nr:hypothetical protein L2E82_24539 [Cichorium intybus]
MAFHLYHCIRCVTRTYLIQTNYKILSLPEEYKRQQLLFEEVAKMQNEEGQNMDLYIPRKCSATNRLITSKDHASVQINVGHVDESGRYTGQFSTFALCGFVRAQGDADSALDRLWQKKKVEARQ